jgi:hypothetical protein
MTSPGDCNGFTVVKAPVCAGVTGAGEAPYKSTLVIPNRRQAVRNLLYFRAVEDFSLRSK